MTLKMSKTLFYLFILCLLTDNIQCTRKGAKWAKPTKSTLARYEEPTCAAITNSTDEKWLLNITSFQETLKKEMEDNLNKFADNILKTMEHQISCFQLREKQIVKDNKCDAEMINPIPIKAEEPKVCETPECKALSSRMLHSIDHKTNPCDDFYQYACGGVEKDTNLMPQSPLFDTRQRLKDKLETLKESNEIMGQARVFYDSCRDHFSKMTPPKDTLSYAKALAKKFGSFITSDHVDNNSLTSNLTRDLQTSNLTYLLASFMKSDFAPFFDVDLEIEPTEPHALTIRISLTTGNHKLSPDIGEMKCLDEFRKVANEYRRDLTTDLDMNKHYMKYLECKTRGIGRQYQLERAVFSTSTLFDSDEGLEDIEKLLTDTKNVTESLLQSYDDIKPLKQEMMSTIIKKDYKESSLEDLPADLGDAINWVEFLHILTGTDVSLKQTIHIYHRKEISDFITEIHNKWIESKEDVHNSLLLLWNEKIYSDLVSPLETPSNYCLDVTQFLMPDILSVLYLHSFPDAQLAKLNRETQKKADEIRNYMLNILTEAAGKFEPELKTKISNMKINIGPAYDIAISNSSLIDNVKDLQLNTTYAYNVDTLLHRKRKLLYSLLNKNPDSAKAMWMQGILPMMETSMHSYELNEIYIPYGMLLPPYLYPGQDFPKYVTASGLDYVIAREMMHLFDETGRKYDGKKKKSEQSFLTFVASSECINNGLFDRSMVQVDEGLYAIHKNSRNSSKLNDLLANAWGAKLAWASYDVSSTRDARGPMTEEHLIWMGGKPLNPLQVYFLRIAQNQCRKSSELDLLGVMEANTLSPFVRVNLMMRHEPKFADAFECTRGHKNMASPEPCSSPLRVP